MIIFVGQKLQRDKVQEKEPDLREELVQLRLNDIRVQVAVESADEQCASHGL